MLQKRNSSFMKHKIYYMAKRSYSKIAIAQVNTNKDHYCCQHHCFSKQEPYPFTVLHSSFIFPFPFFMPYSDKDKRVNLNP